MVVVTEKRGRTMGWRMMLMAVALTLAACVPMPDQMPGTLPDGAPITPPSVSADQKARNFVSVVQQMEPAIEQQCLARRRTPVRCDFQFVVDDRPGLEPNAFQTVDAAGRPIIGFTISLINETHNSDEIAFVVGHEASHHILGHLDAKASSARTGAIIFGTIAAAAGIDATAVQGAQSMGAQLGSRYFSKDWELQADYLGAIIAAQAGYDPMRGAAFFDRLPDPGDRVMGSHPSRNARKAQVARALDDLRSGRAR